MINRHWIGMRIEGYKNRCYIFTDKKKALDFAYNKACTYHKVLYVDRLDESDYVKAVYNNSGAYAVNDDHYSWALYSVHIEQNKLNFDNDIIIAVKVDD